MLRLWRPWISLTQTLHKCYDYGDLAGISLTQTLHKFYDYGDLGFLNTNAT